MTEDQKDVAKKIIIGLAVVGVVSVAIIAPGISKALPLLSKIDPARIYQELRRLRKRGLIEVIKKRNGLTSIKLTKEGKKKLAAYEMNFLKLDKPTKWDRKWRVIIFDIPIKKNISRELLRRKMKKLGFYQLQKSVFVHPSHCYEVVEFLRSYFGVKAEVEYMEVEKFENQDKLVEFFFT